MRWPPSSRPTLESAIISLGILDARQVSQVIALQVDHLEVVRVDFEQSEGIDVIRQHQTIDRAGKRCDDDVDRCDQHQGSMAAPSPADIA
ncbi:MAG: hypothetical protein R6W06_02805 [Prochlorococcaceae cyanobacterium]